MTDQFADSLDSLSAIGRRLLRLDAETAYGDLIVRGEGNPAAKMVLENITSRDLIDGAIASPEDADAVLAALWLRHDWLDASHRVSQKIETANGAFWHAIVHRREGDFANAKYWYQQVSDHPLLATIGARTADVINPYPADKTIFKIVINGFNASAYVDLVEAVATSENDPRKELAVAIQHMEWRTLFEFCTRAASGK